MPMRLTRWACVAVLAVAAGGFAADKPKKEKPADDDPPTDAEVMRVYKERLGSNFNEETQGELEIVKYLVADKVDPPRFYGPVGIAEMHRCKWECGVSHTASKGKPKVEIIYIDKSILRACAPKDVAVPMKVPEAK